MSFQKSIRAKHLVIPVECGSDVEMTAMAGALAIARTGGETGELFEKMCREHLCIESWDFIVDVSKYEVQVSAFKCCRRTEN